MRCFSGCFFYTRLWLLISVVLCLSQMSPVQAGTSGLTLTPQTGTFQANDKTVIVRDGFIRVITGGRQWTQGFFYCSTQFRSFINPQNLLNKKQVADATKQRVTFTALVPLNKTGKTAAYTLVAQALENGNLSIHTTLRFANAQDKALYKNGSILMQFSLADLKGATVQADQWKHTYGIAENHSSKKKIFVKRQLKRVEMFANQPKRSFVISASKGQLVYLEYHSNNRAPYAEIAIRPTRQLETAFVITLPSAGKRSEPSAVTSDQQLGSGSTYAGKLNLLKYEGLVSPNYTLSRNLIQNPSFEGGFHNWWPGRLPFTDLPNEDFISIDGQEAYRGKYSLHGKIQKGQCAFSAYHMAIPVLPGQSYTFSFYAKADQPGVKVGVLGVTSQWGKWALANRVLLTTEWKRYRFEFTAEHRIVTLGIGERWWESPDDQIENANIWIDCVQLEQGTLTDYTEKPIQSELVTGKFAQTYEANKPKHATLRIHNLSTQSRKINVQVQVKDFFDKTRQTLKFKLDLAAQSIASYPLDFSKVMGTGLYTLSVRTQSKDFADTDYFRMAVIKPLNNTHQHKNIFSMIFQGRYWWKKRFDYLKRIGIGSVISGFGYRVDKTDQGIQRIPIGGQGPYPQPFMYELARKNRILAFASIFKNGHAAGDMALETPEAYTDEGIRKIEAYCMNKALQYPDVMYWKLINEPDAIGIPDRIEGVDMAKLVQAMLAARRGIRKGNPKARVSSPDPYNMYQAGRDWLRRYIEAGGDKTFDIAAIHTYRPTPELPDMDADAQALIQMLDQQGYTGDIWWTEGMLWYPYTIPQLNVTAYKGNSASHAYFGTLSYDLGRSEKIAAAFVARHYLVALKYSRRVKMDLEWGTPRYFIDWNQTPRAFIYAANTLGNLLGNATYRQDVDVVPDTHIYVFEDERKRPVAAMWNYASEVNHFEVEPPVARFDFKSDEVEVIDFMMNPVPQSDSEPVTVVFGPYPTFLIGKPGSLASFTRTLKKMDLGGKNFVPLHVITRMRGNIATVSVANILSKSLSGTVAIQLAGQTVQTRSVAFMGKSKKHLQIDLSRFAKPGQVTPVPLSLRFTNQKQETKNFDQSFRLGLCPKRKSPIKIDGKLDDWKQVPGIAMGVGNLVRFNKQGKSYAGASDLSATLQTTWDDKGLYLAIRVKDNIYVPYIANGPGHWFKGDSLQVYFDTWANGRDSLTGDSFDNNDYVYNIGKNAADKGAVFRSYAPEWQVAFLKLGLAPEVTTAIRREGNKTVYEIFFPKRQLVPIKMQTGRTFGFAILVNDRDQADRKQGLTLTPAGTEPYMHPRLYPLWLLTD